jgi:hypothetical protein
MSYSKLHSSIVNSSLWTEPDSVRILFVTLLAMCDQHGEVQGSKLGLNRIANIDLDDAGMAWSALMSPDRNSSDRLRNPENEGRRVEEIPGGFRLLNFAYYRGLRNEDDRREQNRRAQLRFREKSQSKPTKAEVSPRKPRKAQAEAEAEAEAETEAEYVLLPDHEKPQPVRWKAPHGFQNIMPSHLRRWSEAYPACNVERQLKQMHEWLLANPERARKSNWLKFITNWLKKEQDRGGDKRNETNRRNTAEGSRNVGTANEGRSPQYAGVGKVR